MNAKTWGGDCSFWIPQIRISKPYHDAFPEELEDTMLHEMIHLKYHKHDKKFYKEMERIQKEGGTVHRRLLHTLRDVAPKHIYKCASCSHESRTFKTMQYWKMRCKCGGTLQKIF
jgi:predicted SprT family Zn-dependent metalloprotease